MKIKKKVLTLAVASVMAVSSVFSLAACGDDSSGTVTKDTYFAGSVSATTYTDEDAAASAFIDTEVSGAVTEAEFVAYTPKKELSEKEIAKLEIPEEEKSDIQRVEEGEIEYEEYVEEAVQASATKRKKVKVIIIYYPSYCKYYAPALSSGDTVTRSYYDSVFNPDNFTNFTAVSKTSGSMTLSANKQSMTMRLTTNITMTVDRNYVYCVQTASVSAMGQSESQKTEMFLIFDDGVFSKINTVYLNLNGEWMDGDIQSQIGTENVGSFIGSNFDNTYFTKTSYGFEISEEKYSQYMNDVLKDSLGELGSLGGINLDMSGFKASAQYYVVDGKIDKCVTKVNGTMKMSQGDESMSISMNMTETQTYSKYGKTTVKIPTALAEDIPPQE